MDRDGYSLLLVPRGNEGRGVKELRLSGTKIVIAASTVILLAVIFVAMASTFGSAVVDRVRYTRLQQENDVLRAELLEMNQSVLTLRAEMDLIAERDNILRPTADLDPLEDDLRRMGVGGTRRDFDSELLFLSSSSGRMAKDTETLLNQMHREAALELESLLEIENRIAESQQFFSGFPSVWPIDRTKYHAHVSSPYGRRTHPVTGQPDFHEGNDIVAARGTPIIATADGRIVKTQDGLKKGSRELLGNFVKIDHGNGYVTYYGHLERLHPRSRVGARVRRGDVIGYLGNSGRTTGYHLHYEIHFDRQDVNPWNYYFNDRWDEFFDRR